jgi:hypothetical protein
VEASPIRPVAAPNQASGPARLHYLDWVLGTLEDVSFPLDVAARRFSVLDSYIYGFGRQQLAATAGEAPPEEMAEAMLSTVPADQYPRLHRVVLLAMDVGYDAEADFAFGLDVILDGLAQVVSPADKRPSAQRG